MVGASLLDQDVFVGLVEGFAVLGSVVGFVSGFAAFLALVSGDSIEAIGQAVNYGIAYGFVPGALLGSLVFVAAATNLQI
jgi:hypothetical protein